MRTLINILLFFFIFILLSCKSKKDKGDADLPITKSSGVDTIHIDLDTISANWSFKDLFSKIEIVPLQTIKTSSLDNCQKVIINEENISKYVILDAKKIELFSFDSIGNFIQKSPLNIEESPIPHIWLFGSGDSFIFNPHDSLYMYYYGGIFSMYNNKTLKYVRKEKVNLDSCIYLYAFIPLNNDLYVFHGITNRTQKVWGDIISFYSKSHDSIVKQQIIPQAFDVFRNYASPFSSFHNRFFYISPVFSNSIYEIHPDSLSVTPFLIMNYGKKTLTVDNINDFYWERDKSKNYAYLNNMLQNNQSYWFFSYFNGNVYISVYSKRAKEIQTVRSVDFITYFPLLTDKILYGVVDAKKVQEVIDSGILTEEDANRLAKVKPDDNPVILKCYLK